MKYIPCFISFCASHQNYGEITSDSPKRMTTYHGHKWQMVVDGYVVNEWIIDAALGDDQHFVVTELDVSRVPQRPTTREIEVGSVN
jgi:hypothetical protein